MICLKYFDLKSFPHNGLQTWFFFLDQCMINFGKKCYGEKHHVEFPDFVQCVVELMEIEKTERFGHVQTTYSRCGICDYPYNYVGKYHHEYCENLSM